MSSGLAPRYPQGRRVGLTLMGEKWLGTTFSILLSFTSAFLRSLTVSSNVSVFHYYFSLLRTTKEMSSMTAYISVTM